MKKYSEQFKKHLNTVIRLVSRYSLVIFLLMFAILAGYLVTRIGFLSRLEPSQTQIDSRVSEIKKTKTDAESISKLKELEGRNISVESLFDNGRTNPFED